MTFKKVGLGTAVVFASMLSAVGTTYADEASAVSAEAPAASAEAPAATPAPAAEQDGVRFRGGISAGGGLEMVSAGDLSVSAAMGGIDGRIGAQINDLIGVYAQPHLSFGSFDNGLGLGGLTGTISGTALVDFTFIDRIFVAAGAGYGVLNNPNGPALHFRAGGYPLVGDGENGIRRKGLMVGADLRVIFVDGATAIFPMGSIGYEAF